MEDNVAVSPTLKTKALSWFDGLTLEQREYLLSRAGRSYFTFGEMIDEYVKYLEMTVLMYNSLHSEDENEGCLNGG